MGRLRDAASGFLLALLAFPSAPIAVCAATATPISFTIENPDPAELAGHLSSIKIDAQGSSHIAYIVPTTAGNSSELRYASKDGVDWVWEVVATGVNVSADLALDPSGEPWIAFHARDEEGIYVYDRIKVAHRHEGVWTIDTIGDTDASISNAAIAFDPAGIAHVVWGTFTRGFRTNYATWNASGWSAELVHQASFGGEGNFGLAFDAQGAPHVVAATGDGVLHAVFVSPGWSHELRPVRFFPSLALDSSGQPHIASIRIDSLPMILEYQWRGTDGVWHQEDLGTLSGNFPPAPSLQLDPNDRPIIAITEGATNTEGGTLRLMRKPGDEWITDEVDAGSAGLYPSLALADGVHPRISYSIEGSGLHYAAEGVASEVLPARAFIVGGARTVALAGPSQSDLCIQLEPLNSAFQAEDLVASSIVMRSEGTGTVSEIHARDAKGSVIGDRDRNGVSELGACFARADLAALFSSLVGRTTVSVVIEGSLASGVRVSAPLELTVLLPKGLAARIYPNPLNPTGRLSFTLRQSGSLRVMLFDVSGRMVRVLADERRAEAGPREIAFDGADDRGRTLATGIYFYRIETAGDVLTGRIAIAK